MEVIYRSFSIVLIVLFCVAVLKFFVLKGLSGWFVKDKNGVADFPYLKKLIFLHPLKRSFSMLWSRLLVMRLLFLVSVGLRI